VIALPSTNTKPRLRRILLLIFDFMLFKFLSVFGLPSFLGRRSLGEGGWSFTEVLQEIRRDITRNVWIFQETADYGAKTDKSPDLKPRMNTNSQK
jgi:hypothetical protein